jgi:hypothetical protein
MESVLSVLMMIRESVDTDTVCPIVTIELLERLKNPAVRLPEFMKMMKPLDPRKNNTLDDSRKVRTEFCRPIRTWNESEFIHNINLWNKMLDYHKIDPRLVSILVDKVIVDKSGKGHSYRHWLEEVDPEVRLISPSVNSNSMNEDVLNAWEVIITPDALPMALTLEGGSSPEAENRARLLDHVRKVVKKCQDGGNGDEDLYDLSFDKKVIIFKDHNEILLLLEREVTPLFKARYLCLINNVKFQDVFTTEVLIQLFDLGLPVSHLTEVEKSDIQTYRQAMTDEVSVALDGYIDLASLSLDYLLPQV